MILTALLSLLTQIAGLYSYPVQSRSVKLKYFSNRGDDSCLFNSSEKKKIHLQVKADNFFFMIIHY